jgi:hypothetical protein
MAAVRKKKTIKRSSPVAAGVSHTDSGAQIPVGDFDFGDFDRFEPVSWNYGFSRGGADRSILHRTLLKHHRARIRGRVLEVEERTYTINSAARKSLIQMSCICLQITLSQRWLRTSRLHISKWSRCFHFSFGYQSHPRINYTTTHLVPSHGFLSNHAR